VADDVIAWFGTEEASEAARRYSQRLKLAPGFADEVFQHAVDKALRTRQRGVPPPENPAAYGERIMRNAAVDLYRKEKRRSGDVPVDDLLPDRDDPGKIDVSGELEDTCRRIAHGRIALKPWAMAAVLNELTFLLHADVAIPAAAPQPRRPGDEERVAWASLWLAGEHNCFPAAGKDDDEARRQRRSRALKVVAEQLRQTVETALAVSS
jgi:hypothetical protein